MFTQIGLDSGSLTIFGTVVRNFPDPGEYRGVLHRGEDIEAIFYIKVDKNSPVAQVNIDLAKLSNDVPEPSKYSSDKLDTQSHYVVHPKGYALFHVSGGSGSFYVHVRKAEEGSKHKPFDSRELSEGDIFSAIIIRPGTYSVTNLLSKARGEIVVSYPKIGKTAYIPPDPIRVECKEGTFEPEKVKLQPGQGLIYHIITPSRIKIVLLKPDDGPEHRREPTEPGWKKPVLGKNPSQNLSRK